MKFRTIFFFSMLALVSLSACQSEPPEEIVSGTLTYLPRIALAPGSLVEVFLQDTSKADAPAETLGTWSLTTKDEQVPLDWLIPYNPENILPQNSYTVRATIKDPQGKLIFTTTTVNPVITRGNPTTLDLVLDPVP